MQQHALRRIDAETLEQLWVAQGQLDHLADLIDGVAEAADIVVGDVGAPPGLRLLEERPEFDLCPFRHVDDAAGLCGDDDEADLLQAVGRPSR